jgi:hypothetical protein
MDMIIIKTAFEMKRSKSKLNHPQDHVNPIYLNNTASVSAHNDCTPTDGQKTNTLKGLNVKEVSLLKQNVTRQSFELFKWPSRFTAQKTNPQSKTWTGKKSYPWR